MTSPRALLALAVAVLAAYTGKVPLISPPVRALMSFVLPSFLGGGGGESGGAVSFSSNNVAADEDGGSSSGPLRASRLLSIALRNATSDYDELASIVSEWFRSPEHGAQDEAAFVEFLKIKAKRPHRSLEKGLDWLLWVYRTFWPLVALAAAARLTSPPTAAQRNSRQEDEEEEEMEMEGYAFAGEEQEAQLFAARAAAAQNGFGGPLSPSFALHARAGGVPAAAAATTAAEAAQAHLSMLSPRAKAAVAHAAAVAGNNNGNGSPLGSDRSKGSLGSHGRQQVQQGQGAYQQQHRAAAGKQASSSSFADVFSRAAQALGGVGGGGGSGNGSGNHSNNDAASAGGSSSGRGGAGGAKGNNSLSSPKLAAIRTGGSNLSPRRGSLDEHGGGQGAGGAKGGSLGARRNLNGGSGVIRASYS